MVSVEVLTAEPVEAPPRAVLASEFMRWLVTALSVVAPEVPSVVASALVVSGFQSVLFWIFARVYAGSEGFIPNEPYVQRVLAKLSLERGIVLGSIIGIAGLVGLVSALTNWQAARFGQLNFEHALRLLVPSATALVVSSQLILGTFFLSLLGIKQTRHTQINAEAKIKVSDEPVTAPGI